MAIVLNGKKLKEAWLNGKKLKEAWLNGQKVFPEKSEYYLDIDDTYRTLRFDSSSEIVRMIPVSTNGTLQVSPNVIWITATIRLKMINVSVNGYTGASSRSGKVTVSLVEDPSITYVISVIQSKNENLVDPYQ